ncbi:hypothetical protein JY430_21640, partial [Stenotrophomonas maltophilia]|nr:hypothetical protein [Stenotrophomonas maltophilia]
DTVPVVWGHDRGGRHPASVPPKVGPHQVPRDGQKLASKKAGVSPGLFISTRDADQAIASW